MYEQQDPFKLTDFVTMSYFLNQFLYKAVLNNLFGKLNLDSEIIILFFFNYKNLTIKKLIFLYFLINIYSLNSSDIKSVSNNPLFTSLHTLLMAIYRRDCRRSFCPDGHWLAKLSTQCHCRTQDKKISQEYDFYFDKFKQKKTGGASVGFPC